MKKTMGNVLLAAACVVAAPIAFGQAAPAERTDAPAATGSKEPGVRQSARQGARQAINDPVLKCNGLEGTEFLSCLDRAGYGPRTGTANREAVRSQVRKQDTDPRERCHEFTGNERLACEQQARSAARPK